MLKNGFYRRLAIDLGRLPRTLRRDRRGNVAMMFALMALPIVALMGLGVDYYRGLSDKSRLDAASDAAALAAISAAQQYISANSQTQTDPTLTNNATAAGIAQAQKAFMANAGTVELVVPATPQISMARTGQTLTATVAYSGQTPTSFGGIVGVNALHISGTSSASMTMGKYLDFYLLLDVSGSMGIPTSAAGQNQLAKINPDNKSNYPTGCTFACHFSGSAGFGLTRGAIPSSPTIPLRADSVGYAVQQLLQTASTTQTLINEFRVGIYPFIDHAIQAAALSSSIDPNSSIAATVAGNLANYLDQGTTNSGMGSGGTNFENLWTDLKPYLKGVGDGSSATSPQPFIFIVTDGADNNQVYTPSTSSWTGSQPQLPSVSLCTNAKAAGYWISVLYIPYVPIQNPNPSFAGDEDDKVNNIIPSIPGVLQNCASPGFFFTANTAKDINNAMQAMFAQALQAARLTN
jgi:Flp pilus assembly protein TadG